MEKEQFLTPQELVANMKDPSVWGSRWWYREDKSHMVYDFNPFSMVVCMLDVETGMVDEIAPDSFLNAIGEVKMYDVSQHEPKWEDDVWAQDFIK